jgi:hypothetical protein
MPSKGFTYRFLTPEERYKLLDNRDKLKMALEKVEKDICISENVRCELLIDIRKLTRMIDTGKEQVRIKKEGKK